MPEIRIRKLAWAMFPFIIAVGAVAVMAAYVVVTIRDNSARHDASQADRDLMRARVDENSRRIDLSTDMARQARGDHAHILAELKAIREAVERRP
jgi:hypothetical protein